MSDTDTAGTEQTTEQPKDEVDTTTTTEDTASQNDEAAKGEAAQGEAAKGEAEDELPEWARKALTKARTEAAKYRTSLRETESKLSGAKSPEELDAAVKSVQAENEKLQRELLVSDTARRFDLPDDLRAVLTGGTKEELEARAKVLQKYASPASAPGDLSGGLDPNEDDAFDPVAAAREARKRRY